MRAVLEPTRAANDYWLGLLDSRESMRLLTSRDIVRWYTQAVISVVQAFLDSVLSMPVLVIFRRMSRAKPSGASASLPGSLAFEAAHGIGEFRHVMKQQEARARFVADCMWIRA